MLHPAGRCVRVSALSLHGLVWVSALFCLCLTRMRAVALSTHPHKPASSHHPRTLTQSRPQRLRISGPGDQEGTPLGACRRRVGSSEPPSTPRVWSSGLLAVRAGESRPLWRQVCAWSHFRHLGRVAGLAVTHGCPLCLLSPVTPAAKPMEPLKGASCVGGLFKVLPLGSRSLAGETAPRTSLGQRNCVHWGLARAGPGIYLGQFITQQRETDTPGRG